jgi:hypothetical protein
MIEISILQTRPDSGTYDEFEFSNSNELLWVKFVEDSFETWIGKFKLGMKINKCKIVTIENTSYVIILSGGIIDVFDFDRKVILNSSKIDHYEDIHYMPVLDVLVATDGLRLFIMNPITLMSNWTSKRISWDGVSFDRYEERLIFGILNDLSPDGTEFEFDVTNRYLKAKYNVKPS